MNPRRIQWAAILSTMLGVLAMFGATWSALAEHTLLLLSVGLVAYGVGLGFVLVLVVFWIKQALQDTQITIQTRFDSR